MLKLTSLVLVALALSLCGLALLVQGSALVRPKRSSLTDEAERMIRQGSNVNTQDVGQLADLVSRNQAEDCLARVICELTQNPKSHGDSGAKFAQSLLKFRQSKHPKVKKYTEAMNLGVRAKNGDQCKSTYAQCNGHTTTEVIQVGNKILK